MFFGKEVRILLKGQAKDSYLELKKRNDKEAQIILNSIERIKEILRQNPQYGDPVPKRLIPNELIKQGIQNLYRVELSNFWRKKINSYTQLKNEEHLYIKSIL